MPVSYALPRRAASVLAAVCAVVAGCGGGASPSATPTPTPQSTITPAATASPSAVPTPTPAPTPAPLRSPLVIQVENLYAARPQSGLSGADMVYEYETEGGISRFSAFFFTQPSGPVGPVRSARLATLQLLRIYDGTLLYSGAGEYVSGLLRTDGLRSYNENTAGADLFRISSRSAPHNLYTDTVHAADLIRRAGVPAAGYALWPRTPVAQLPPGGTPATRVVVQVSASERPVYTYNAATGGYSRTEPDTGLLTDADTRQPWSPSAIVVLQVPVSVSPQVVDAEGTHGLVHTVVGSGPGQLLAGGVLYPITYTQGASGPPQLTLPDGTAAPVPPGQVLVELVRTGFVARAV